MRPLGVRGEPLHNTHAQLRSVIRRRLGDAPADLLAEPQLRETGDGIDWYAGWDGPVRRFAELALDERSRVLADIGPQLASIASLGEQLGTSDSDEARLVGRSLDLATKRPSDDFIYMVGDRPVIVAWGYEADAAATLLAPALPVAAAVARPAVFASAPAVPMAGAPLGWWPWLKALLIGLLLLLALLLASWLLRSCMPTPPDLNIATLETPAPPPPEPLPDPTPLLKASLTDEQDNEKKLRALLASLEDDLKKKIEACKPIEPPKPPPPPPPKPQAAVQPPPPPPAPPPAPPISRPPPGQLPCDWSGDAGAEGVTRNKHYLGDKPGFVTINYNLYVRPDEIKVMYRGQQIAGTRGPRSGRGGFGFDWRPVGGDYSVDVIVIGEILGTRWTYAMACPRG
ncbi:MAG TPA: hypothetical protein VEC14_14290 [Reyranellaceae bacterium]|nr:hypothetical protein [Reyranellaceae bacterium]